MNQDQTFVVVLVMISSVVFGIVRVLRGPVGAALSRRLSGSMAGGSEGDRDEEVAQLRARVAELEERMDFTERVLMQQPEPRSVSAGGDRP